MPASSLQELAAYAKSHPGKLSYSSSGVGSPLHLAFEDYKRRAGNARQGGDFFRLARDDDRLVRALVRQQNIKLDD